MNNLIIYNIKKNKEIHKDTSKDTNKDKNYLSYIF